MTILSKKTTLEFSLGEIIGSTLADLRKNNGMTQKEFAKILGVSESAIDENTSKSELIIAKHRNGPVCDIPLIFKSNTSPFTSVDETMEGEE